jgi:TRAP-type C4-dicarboxylate transport system substrate-binding protein
MTSLSTSDPTVQAVEDMGKKLSDATGGRLSIQMYASMPRSKQALM